MEDRATIRTASTDQLTARDVDQLRTLLWAAFADDEQSRFSEEDWQHALGGTHFLAEVDGEIVSHASVVERTLHVADVAILTGYVEAVATRPGLQGRGYGTAVMRRVGDLMRNGYELGALGTGSHGFYERLGWRAWRGPSSVRTEAGDNRTPQDDGYIMVLTTPSTPSIDVDLPICCEWRPGDVW